MRDCIEKKKNTLVQQEHSQLHARSAHISTQLAKEKHAASRALAHSQSMLIHHFATHNDNNNKTANNSNNNNKITHSFCARDETRQNANTHIVFFHATHKLGSKVEEAGIKICFVRAHKSDIVLESLAT